MRELGLSYDSRERLGSELARPIHRRDDDGGAAVVELRRVARGDGPAGLERGLKLREPVQARFARRLVLVHDRDGALSPRDLDGNDLRIERALALRAERLLVRPKREAVLLLPPEAALLGDELAPQTHVAVTVRIHEPVGEVRVFEVVLAER